MQCGKDNDKNKQKAKMETLRGEPSLVRIVRAQQLISDSNDEKEPAIEELE